MQISFSSALSKMSHVQGCAHFTLLGSVTARHLFSGWGQWAQEGGALSRLVWLWQVPIHPVSSVHACDCSFLGCSVGFSLIACFCPGGLFQFTFCLSSITAFSQPFQNNDKIDRNRKGVFRGMSFFKFCLIEHLLFASDCVKALRYKIKYDRIPDPQGKSCSFWSTFLQIEKIGLGLWIEFELYTYSSLHT